MKPIHTLLAIFVAVIWGVAFIATRFGLDSFTATQLAVLRFLIGSIAIFFVPRPQISLKLFLYLGFFLFTFQFLFQFFGIANGMPPGLASVIVQTQVFFTIFFAAFVFKEQANVQQILGIVCAVVGIMLISFTIGKGLSLIGLCLTLLSAISWGIGNIFLKQLKNVDMFSLVVWLSLVPPLPALLLSFLIDDRYLISTLSSASWLSIVSVLYLGLVATVLAYAVWGRLLQLYSAVSVTPFALLTPIVGAIASAIVFGEEFTPLRLSGIIVMLIGLCIIVMPINRLVALDQP